MTGAESYFAKRLEDPKYRKAYEAARNKVCACEHCGTVYRALRNWTDDEIAGCECPCHTVLRGKPAPKKARKTPTHKTTAGSKRPLKNTRTIK